MSRRVTIKLHYVSIIASELFVTLVVLHVFD